MWLLHGAAYTRFVPGPAVATRTTIVVDCGIARGLQPCPILHKQEATGNCRRLIRWISRNQIWPFLCPAQDSLVAKDRRKGLTQDSISKYYKESTLALALAQVLGPRTASFKKPFARAQLLVKCGRVRTTSQKL